MSDDERRHRTIWVSDVHLGWSECMVDAFLDFIKKNKADTWYLVGDVVDGWMLRRNWGWPQKHSDVIQKLLREARKGSRIVWVVGNHDAFLRSLLPLSMGNLTVVDEAIHETADGRRILVIHGDIFDVVVKHVRWLAVFGSYGYSVLLSLGRVVDGIRGFLGLERWSLSAYIKQGVKGVIGYIGNYQKTVEAYASSNGMDGVVCGHIHKAAADDARGYYNAGDWVESCTAIVEDDRGNMRLLSFDAPPRKG